MHNERESELRIAAGEQDKITLLRLKKLIQEKNKILFVEEKRKGVGFLSDIIIKKKKNGESPCNKEMAILHII